MNYHSPLNESDKRLKGELRGFIPAEIYDIHAHPYHPAHFAEEAWKGLSDRGVLGCAAHRESVHASTDASKIHGLYFGMPHRSSDRAVVNEWVEKEVDGHGTDLSRKLLLAAPVDDPASVAEQLRSGRFSGLKVYHVYAGRADTMEARLEEYAPEWMWEILHETRGVLLLHIVRTDAVVDADNQKSLRKLCGKYPDCRLVLAHIARSFNYRHARKGLKFVEELQNAVVDTSAVTETESIRAAIEHLGPRHVLFGSDFAVSDLRGRCVATGERFFWLHKELLSADYAPPTQSGFTHVGIESLLCLKEACEDSGLNRADVEDIFLNNALRLLSAHLPHDRLPKEVDGNAQWREAREIISCGTGLMSKRAELFNPNTWPAYFSRCSGCYVWDLQDRRYVDFAGGIGAILLGYADPDVNAAVRRRLDLGTYCTLVNPQEVELAKKLLSLHPWAGKVRYARGGGEAMTVAVRCARASTGKSGVAFCGYHGWHDWYLAANLGEEKALDGHLLPGLEPKGVPRELAGTAATFMYNDLDSLRVALDKLDGNLAAVVMEPMRSQWPKDDFLHKAAAACRERGAVFVVDEITSGLRFGYPGALSKLNVEPDIVVYAKAFSNGFPFGAVIGRGEVMDAAEASFISSSYWTDGVGPAAVLAVLEKVEREKAHEVVWKHGEYLQNEMRRIAEKFPVCKLGVGGMPACPTLTFNLGKDAPHAQAILTRKMQERGFLISGIYYVMLAHRQHHIDALLENLEAAIREIAEIIAQHRLAEESQVSGASKGFARLA